MRERKYKFWDKHNKVWVGPYTLEQLADHDKFSSDREYQPICSKWECFIPVEYIGIKDRKGQEIWEGDIVRYDGSQGVVTWSKTAPQFIPFPSARMLDNRWEVVGNVYEHSNLLEQQG